MATRRSDRPPGRLRNPIDAPPRPTTTHHLCDTQPIRGIASRHHGAVRSRIGKACLAAGLTSGVRERRHTARALVLMASSDFAAQDVADGYLGSLDVLPLGQQPPDLRLQGVCAPAGKRSVLLPLPSHRDEMQ